MEKQREEKTVFVSFTFDRCELKKIKMSAVTLNNGDLSRGRRRPRDESGKVDDEMETQANLPRGSEAFLNNIQVLPKHPNANTANSEPLGSIALAC